MAHTQSHKCAHTHTKSNEAWYVRMVQQLQRYQGDEEAAQVELGENGHFINANRIPMWPN